MGKITIVLEESGITEAEVDADEYAEAKAAGSLDAMLDCWASDIDSDITVTEPDGTTFDLYGGDYEPHRPANAASQPEWTIAAAGTLAYVKLSDAYAVGDGAWQPTGPGPLVGNATIDDLLSDGCVKILRVGMGGAE
jgi:hypothetical protein